MKIRCTSRYLQAENDCGNESLPIKLITMMT